MKNKYLLTIVLALFWPLSSQAGDQEPEFNVNERYEVESVRLSGVDESRISKELQEDMQKMVGEKYRQKTAHDLARRIRKELRGYSIKVRVRRGDQPDHVKVIFAAEKSNWKRFELPIPPLVYHSKLGWSGALDIPIRFHHSVLTFGMVNSAEELLERNAGIRLRYENRKVGTEALQLRIDFDSYHQKWNPATEAALAESPEIPGVYRTRQNFAPSVSIIPVPEVKLSAGLSFQRFQTQYPAIRTEKAYAATADIRYRNRGPYGNPSGHSVSMDYSVRSATRALDSDYVYTRHFWSAGYSASRGRNLFGAHFQGGLLTGSAPLFERFSLGDSSTLRGWNKFDVAPLGGSRAAHGTLEYRYDAHPLDFHAFYDVGSVWDRGHSARARHGIGFGLATQHSFYMYLAFPVRLNRVTPVFMVGIRTWGEP